MNRIVRQSATVQQIYFTISHIKLIGKTYTSNYPHEVCKNLSIRTYSKTDYTKNEDGLLKKKFLGKSMNGKKNKRLDCCVTLILRQYVISIYTAHYVYASDELNSKIQFWFCIHRFLVIDAYCVHTTPCSNNQSINTHFYSAICPKQID